MSSLCETVFMNLEIDATERIPLVTRLVYETDDPFAVRVRFELQEDVSVTWTIERDLLSQGLAREVGDGDVRVSPQAVDGRREARIELAGCGLDGEWGRAVFSAWEPALRDFLDRTYELVPPGEEAVDVDAFLSQILAMG
ncbi:SsgA family sporulation/cell division regulator [Streptomyces xanthochromogenes]|uniref:SsgA family sporulation/cell division regulator n=1 Tax=Streptomyces xanthochromogenes TaxID=67384 RepID=UPI00342625AE